MDRHIYEKIIEQIDIVEVISEAVKLRRRGANFVGLCPFHQEKTPSFTVSPEKKIFKCFGCGKSGNAISFLMEFYEMSFYEALKELANRAGIKLEPQSYDKSKEEITRREQIFQALQSAKMFYQKTLFTQGGLVALNYLKNRGYVSKTIEDFGLGYSPSGWDTLAREFTSKGFTTEILVAAGLIKQRENKPNEYYDVFRERVMFPIYDRAGKVVGFGGRILKETEDQAKYINSPQSEVFDKSKLLFGLYQGKNEIRGKDSAILVEGYADVISLHQAGFKNAVASCGTSLTTEQLQVLQKYCKTLYIAFDGDEAGKKATERAIQLALPLGFEVLVVKINEGEDPDSIVRKYGANAFHRLIDNAISFVKYFVDIAQEKDILTRPAQKSLLIKLILKHISRIPDKLQHDDYLSELAELVRVSYSQLRELYKSKEKIQLEPDFYFDDPKEISETQATAPKVSDLVHELLPEEKNLLKVCLNHKEVIDFLEKIYKFNFSKMISTVGQELYKILQTHKGKDLINSILVDMEVGEKYKDTIVDLSMDVFQPSPNWYRFSSETKEVDFSKVAKEVYSRLRIKQIDLEKQQLQTQLKSNPILVSDIAKRLQDLAYERQKLISGLK